MTNPEHNEQVAVVSWFKMQHPKLEKCIIAIPNGTHIAGNEIQRAIKMKKLKKEGLKPGASDLFIAVPKNGYCGLWLEMKAKGKKLSSVSKNQMDHIGLMNLMGYRAEWAAGSEIAIEIIREYMSNIDKNVKCRDDHKLINKTSKNPI